MVCDHDIDLFEVRRAHIELFARWLEETGRARSTIARRLSTVAGFYRYCTEEQLIDHSPAAHVGSMRMIESFQIEVPDSDLEDLRQRLSRLRLGPPPVGDAWESGVDSGRSPRLPGSPT